MKLSLPTIGSLRTSDNYFHTDGPQRKPVGHTYSAVQLASWYGQYTSVISLEYIPDTLSKTIVTGTKIKLQFARCGISHTLIITRAMNSSHSANIGLMITM